MALSNWNKFRIERGISNGDQETDEEKKYRQDLSLQRYQQYKEGTEVLNRNNNFAKPVVPQQPVNNDPEYLSEANDVVTGNAIPIELKKYNEQYMNVPEQARGLLHAYGENYINGDTMSSGTAHVRDAEKIRSLTGMDNINELLTGSKQMARYYRDVDNGKGYDYLSDPQKLAFAEDKINSIPDIMLKKEMGYLVDEYSNFRDPINEPLHQLMRSRDASRLAEEFGIPKNMAKDYVEYAALIGAKNAMDTVTSGAKIDPNASGI